MSDLDDRIRRQKAAVMEMLRNKLINPPQQYHSPSSQIIKEINPQRPEILVEDDFTSEDYENAVVRALSDLIDGPPRFYPHPKYPKLIECPRARLLRIGQRAEYKGKPSEFYRRLMEQTENGAKLPHVTERARHTAQKYLDIALKFKEFTESNKAEFGNFKELKSQFLQFREDSTRKKIYASDSTIERALRAHDLDWSAYAIASPRKGKRGKKVIS